VKGTVDRTVNRSNAFPFRLCSDEDVTVRSSQYDHHQSTIITVQSSQYDHHSTIIIRVRSSQCNHQSTIITVRSSRYDQNTDQHNCVNSRFVLRTRTSLFVLRTHSLYYSQTNTPTNTQTQHNCGNSWFRTRSSRTHDDDASRVPKVYLSSIAALLSATALIVYHCYNVTALILPHCVIESVMNASSH
jgi:hypothetical protein